MIYYRLSDNSYQKIRLPGSDKWTCLRNCRDTFATHPFELIADNCSPETLNIFKGGELKLHETYLSNAGSLRYAIDLAASLPDGEIVYFVEDDYLHHPSASMDMITEGLRIVDYVTLYDHPDKYTESYGFGETCKVFKTTSTHWRHTISTCMTFATTARTLREDRETWEKHIGGVHPNDHQVFQDLGRAGRDLAVCIPGKANHCDLGAGIEMQEPWAVEMMIERYLDLASYSVKDDSIVEYADKIMLMRKSPGDTLKMLHAVLNRT